jgi:hypothetical protein
MFKLILVYSLLITNSYAGDSLWSNCKAVTHQEWRAKYDSAEDVFVKRVMELKLEGFRKLPESSLLRQEGEQVFPQDLPDGYAMKSALNMCFENFQNYLNAKDKKVILETRIDLQDCFDESYKLEKPTLIQRMITCFKDLKY